MQESSYLYKEFGGAEVFVNHTTEERGELLVTTIDVLICARLDQQVYHTAVPVTGTQPQRRLTPRVGQVHVSTGCWDGKGKISLGMLCIQRRVQDFGKRWGLG